MNREVPGANVSATHESSVERPYRSLRAGLGLPRTRALVRGRAGRSIVAGFAAIYLGLAMVLGGMIELVATGERGLTFEVLVHPSASAAGWNYPALLVLAPGGIAVLPLGPTLAMATVALGVGLGMGAGLVLALRIARASRAGRRDLANAPVPFATLTPAMVAVLALGACCSTGAVAAGTLGLLAGSGSGAYAQVLGTPWFLNALEILMLYFALLAQEQLISIYSRVEVGRPGLWTSPARAPARTSSVAQLPIPSREGAGSLSAHPPAPP